MWNRHTSRLWRSYTILRLFFSLVLSFFIQYARARLSGRTYDFFEDSIHNRRRAVKLRTAALQLGGVLIKVGQFLSSRVDLLPSEYIEELALLQDEVPGVPFDAIRSKVEQELGATLSTLFRSFDPEPLAAASLGQVHRATLPTGEVVAVKIQRPGIGDIVQVDLSTLRYIVAWMDRHTPIGKRADLPEILREFEDTLTLELDYLREGHHAERIGFAFRTWTSIQVPRVYWSHSTRHVLTLQYMQGIKITDFDLIERAGVSRSMVAETLMRAYLKQVLEDGFFHADPHPGNVFVKPDGTLILLDFGMVGEITQSTRANIRRVFVGVIRRDYDDVLRALDQLGFLTRHADYRVLRRALQWTIETFYTISLGELRSIDPRLVIDRLQEVLYTESFQVPANYAFLGRALGTLSGVCTALDPSFQFVSIAEPYGRRLLNQEPGVRGVAQQIASEARSLASAAYSLPYLTRDALTRVQNGELDVSREIENVTRSLERVERAMRRLLLGVLAAALLVAGSTVISTRYHGLALAGYALAFVLLLLMVVSFRRS